MSPDFVADGIALALLEMVKSGTTCFSDMYFFPEVSARAAQEAGMRAQIAFPLIQFPNAWSSNAAEGFHKGLALHDEHRDDPLLRIAFGPHSAYALGRADLLKALTYAEEIDAPIHMHLHETAGEVEAARRELGASHIHYLAELGLLVPRLQAVHLTHVDDDELELLAESGVRAVHCPQSNLKLGSGTFDIERFRRRGMIVGLGTDGAAANNTLDLFTELRVAALLAKTISGDPTALGAFDALELATLGGARALGLDASIGSIESGKAADLISVDLTYSRRCRCTVPKRRCCTALPAATFGMRGSPVSACCRKADRRRWTRPPSTHARRAGLCGSRRWREIAVPQTNRARDES